MKTKSSTRPKSAKLMPAKQSKTSARKRRDDLRQRRPEFHSFTSAFGLMECADRDWESVRVEKGRFIHPVILRLLTELREDYANRVFGSAWRRGSANNPKPEWLTKGEFDELVLLQARRVWSQERQLQFAAMATAAVACGDDAFFEHVRDAIRHMRSIPGSPPASRVRLAVERAYSRLWKQACRTLGPSISGRMEIRNYPPDWQAIDTEIAAMIEEERRAFADGNRDALDLAKHIPNWGSKPVTSRKDQIEREARILRLTLKKKGRLQTPIFTVLRQP